MDIRKAAVAETSFLHLKDASDELMYEAGADGQPDENKPVGITLYGPGSKTYAKATAARNSRLMERLQKGKSKKAMSAEAQADEQADFLADVTHSFQHLEYDGLQGRELFKAVYTDVTIGFIGDQVGRHLGEWGNFTKGSAKS